MNPFSAEAYSQALEAILLGSDEELHLLNLYAGIAGLGDPWSLEQQVFHRAWEAFEVLGSGGWELLLETSTPLEDYAEALVAIGVPEVRRVFQRVRDLVPTALTASGDLDALINYLHQHFDQLSSLADEYYDGRFPIPAVAAAYIRAHREAFST